MSPPPGGHAAAPGGLGGRDKAAAAKAAATVAAALAGWPADSSPPPTLPPWDQVRATWRGRARVAVESLAYVFDARGSSSAAAVAAGQGGY